MAMSRTEASARVNGDDGSVRTVDLRVTGMNCAGCAGRVERRLNRMPGVSASVNFALAQARVVHVSSVAPDELIAAVEDAGCQATLPEPGIPDLSAEHGAAERRPAAARRHLRGAEHPADRRLHGLGAAVGPLAVVGADPRDAGDPVGRLAVPQGRLPRRAAPHRRDGHPGQHRRARRVRLVAVRPDLGRRRGPRRRPRPLPPGPAGSPG